MITGVAALVWSRWPSMTNTQVWDRLIYSTTDIPPSGVDDSTGHGLVDACRAVLCTPPPPPLTVTINGPDMVMPDVLHTWSASWSSGGTPGSFEWRRDGQLVGSSSNYSYSAPASTEWFMLELEVVRNGETANNTMLVMVGEMWNSQRS